METVKLCKFEKAYIINLLSPHDIMGTSPQYFSAGEISDKLKKLLEKNKVRITKNKGAIAIIGNE